VKIQIFANDTTLHPCDFKRIVVAKVPARPHHNHLVRDRREGIQKAPDLLLHIASNHAQGNLWFHLGGFSAIGIFGQEKPADTGDGIPRLI